MPDGTVVGFPDDMPNDQIKGMIAQKFPHLNEPKNYAWSDVPGAMLENIGGSAGEVATQFGAALSHPGETAKALGKTTIGMAEELIPGQQEYETQYADPFYKGIAKDLGFKKDEKGSITWDQEQLKRNIAERPVQTALSASFLTGEGGAVLGRVPGMVGRVGKGLGTVSKVTNPLAPVKAVTTVAKRAITPLPAEPALTEAAQTLKAAGVPTTAGQRTGTRALKYAESELGGGTTAGKIEEQERAFTKAALSHIGETSDTASPQVMNRAYNRIGGEFNALGARTSIDTSLPTSTFMTDISQSLSDYLNTSSAPIAGIRNMARAMTTRAATGTIPGNVYKSWRSQLARYRRGTTDPEAKKAYGEYIDALDFAMEQNIIKKGNPKDVARWQNARRQYRNYITLERAAGAAGPKAAQGIITPAQLRQAAVSTQGRRAYVQGQGDFSELARAGQAVMTPMPQSGTAISTAVRAIPAIIGGVLGGGATPEGVMGAVAGAATPAVAGQALMSRPVQAYLGNQLTQRVPAIPRGVKTAGRLATVATPKVEQLRQQQSLQQLISPTVYEHLMSNPDTAASVQAWVSSSGDDNSTKALAANIARALKIPKEYNRIYREISNLGEQ